MGNVANVQRIIVLGGGSAGLLSAVTFKLLMPDLDVVVIRSTEIGFIGVGEATTASLPGFLHDDLGFDRAEFYRVVDPSWKLGIRFLWGAAADTEFCYPFRSEMESPDIFVPSNAHYGLPEFSQASLYARLMVDRSSPCLRTADGHYYLDQSFGYHFDTSRLIRFLEQKCAEQNIPIHDRKVAGVTRHDNGFVAALSLDEDESLAGDMFIDCSGFRAQLLGQEFNEPFRAYDRSLFCDAAVVGSWARDEPILPFTTAETMDHGWCWRIDLPDRISRGYVYSTVFCDADTASAELRQKNPQLTGELKTVRFRSGRYERFWVNNVAAIGNSAGFVEPLESTGLHMVMETITALCRALTDTDRQLVPAMQKLANRFVGEMWDDIRDFLAVHFRFNRRLDTPFWRHCRAQTDLAGADEIVKFFQQVGPSRIAHTLLPRQSVFGVRGYLELLVGQGVETAFRFQPTDSEWQAWQDHLQQVAHVAGTAFSMEEALNLVNSDSWQWAVNR